MSDLACPNTKRNGQVGGVGERDLGRQKDLGVFFDHFEASVESNGVIMESNSPAQCSTSMKELTLLPSVPFLYLAINTSTFSTSAMAPRTLRKAPPRPFLWG